MILEERKGDGAVRRFPEGMRVLAVDDDPACLKLIDALLRKCRYDVTITNQAEKALKMLRENKDKFDLVISDVQMPDMDGFKLLELVGLEMDLPVIMLSAYSDTKFVMKGIAHGACDYLIKPVRLEELRNVWQHVIRRKNFEYKDQRKSSNLGRENSESGALFNNVDQNDRNDRKRKEQKTDEEDDDEDDSFENENDDSSAQKKPRVVWSVDLHRKFVAAVNQLGIGKAFPKRILDLMNVEGLTRENVASHLQKYRLYLKRLFSVQQANLAADPSFLHMSSLNELEDLHALSGPGRLYSHGGMFGRLNNNILNPNNSPSSFSHQSHGILRDEPSSHSLIASGIQNEDIFPGIPTSLQLDQFGQSHILPQIANLDESDNKLSVFTVSNVMPDTGLGVTTPTNPNPLLPQKQASMDGFSCQVPVSRVDKNWVQVQSSSNLLPLGNPFHQLPTETQNPQIMMSSSSPNLAVLPSSLEEREHMTCEEGLLGNIVQSVGHFQRQRHSHGSDNIVNALNPIVPSNSGVGSFNQSIDQINFLCDDVKMDMPSTLQLNCIVPPLQKVQTKEDYFLGKPSTGWFDSQW